MPIVKNQEIELTIESLTATGSGVGHLDGFAVFVAGSVPGDRLSVHIIKAKKSYAVGKIVRILKPSPDRVAPDCPVFPRCGGCAWRNMRYEAEMREKRQRVEENFKRLAHLPLPCMEILTPESPLRYRNKAQYPVAKENGVIKIGFFSPRTHRVIDCADCLLQPAEFAGIVSAFRAFLEESGVSVYDAESGKGLVRHLYLRKAYATGEIMVCVVINGKTLPEAERLVEILRAENQNIKSILCNHNTQKTNVILGESCTLLWGQPYITDELCGVQVRLSAQSFYQVNHDMAERLYKKAAERKPCSTFTAARGPSGFRWRNRRKKSSARKSCRRRWRTRAKTPAETKSRTRNFFAATPRTRQNASGKTAFVRTLSF